MLLKNNFFIISLKDLKRIELRFELIRYKCGLIFLSLALYYF